MLDGRYRVQRVIGRGGMAVVYEAMHVDLGRVAVKVLLPELCDSEVVRGRFAREARAAVKLEGEHVARVLDIGTLPGGGAPYLVMEYLHGQDLRRELSERGPLPVALAVDWVLQACAGLAEAHRHGLVHRDLKPSNLFLAAGADGQERIKVLDFGIAKANSADELDLGLTHTGDVFGSPRYMSPEQLRASAQVDARSDVWALGVVLFELLAAQPPFAGATPPEVHAQVLAGAAPRLPRSDVPDGLRAVVARCLEKEPARRFAGVMALARALAPFGPPGAEARLARLTGAAPEVEARVEARDPLTEPVFDEHADTPYTDIAHMRHALDARPPRGSSPNQPTDGTPFAGGARPSAPAGERQRGMDAGGAHAAGGTGPRSSDGVALDPLVTTADLERIAGERRTRRTRALVVIAALAAAPLLYVALGRGPSTSTATAIPDGADTDPTPPAGAETTAAAATAIATATPAATLPSAAISPNGVPSENGAATPAASSAPAEVAPITKASPSARPKGNSGAPHKPRPPSAPPSLYQDRE
jgi:serine/threonine-protein kinase